MEQAGRFGITPEEFWRLTPYEFYLHSKGGIEREKDEWQRTAQNASWIMSAWVGSSKAPSADRLLGKEEEMLDAPLFLCEEDMLDFLKSKSEGK